MGDQAGQAVEGRLYYFPYEAFESVQGIRGPERVALFANMCRLNALYMIARAGSGHIGSSFSSLDIVSWLLLEELNLAPDPRLSGDLFFSSKGHDAPGYYAALLATGRLPFDLLHRLRRLDGLPGHPDISTPGIVTNTGSLGMGVSKAKGMVLANRLLGRHGRVCVMTGDGELQEGQFWESLISASNLGMGELTVIIDHNKLQSDTFVRNVSDLGDLEGKLRAFGWAVERCDGHDIRALDAAQRRLATASDRPKVLVADTIKGRGVSFMEHTALDSDVAMYRFHSGAPDAAAYRRAANELTERVLAQARDLGLDLASPQWSQRDVAVPPSSVQRLVPAYTRALLTEAARNSALVALDADLILDTGLIPFQEQYPERFIECGIAEQDMVSMAGGIALRGGLPVVHSFACFLSARPNEQIYNNATERTHIVYVGSLAGLVPGGPGHSHQAVRDIAALAAVPGMLMLEPCCEEEVAPIVDYCVNRHAASSYIRLVSLPWEIPYRLPGNYSLELGRGVTLREGSDALVIGYGPVTLSSAFHAAELLAAQNSLSVQVVNLPWLNCVDGTWLAELASRFRCVFTLDNHYLVGGQGDRIRATLLEHPPGAMPKLYGLGLTAIPACGSNPEVLLRHGLDAQSLAQRIRDALSQR